MDLDHRPDRLIAGPTGMLREFRRETAGQREPAHLEVGHRAPDRIDGNQRLGPIDQSM